jgi:hypothetical protein
MDYSLWPILLFVDTDIFITKICLDISVLAKSNMGMIEYFIFIFVIIFLQLGWPIEDAGVGTTQPDGHVSQSAQNTYAGSRRAGHQFYGPGEDALTKLLLPLIPDSVDNWCRHIRFTEN